MNDIYTQLAVSVSNSPFFVQKKIRTTNSYLVTEDICISVQKSYNIVCLEFDFVFFFIFRSLVATNDHLLLELSEEKDRHQSEVNQLHWSYKQLKKSIDWIPNVEKTTYKT